MTVYTTLNKIRYYKAQGFDFRAAKRFWKTLLFSLNKKKADDEPVALISVLHSNGLGDAIWCLRTISDEHRYKIVLFAADVAERVLPLFEKQYPTDLRPRQTIHAARDFVAGKIGEKEINTFVKIFFTLDCASDWV
ncbi:MAG: putative immunity protein, partial [Vampirovibrionales bacterium]